MARRKDEKEARLVWRITPDAPLGEIVDARELPRRKPVEEAEAPETREHGWLASSLELLGGVRVSEAPMDTLPGELIDEFMKPRKRGG